MSIRGRHSGIGMIEVLVTLFVLSVGCLAGAAMQMKSLKNTQESLFKSQAVSMANSIVESMRANPEGLALGHYDNIATNEVLTSPNCMATGCNSENIATEDLIRWKTLLSPTDGSLPVLPPMSDGQSAKATVSGSTDGVRTVPLRSYKLVILLSILRKMSA